MSTLSLRKIKHDSSSVDNITLDSSGNIGVAASALSNSRIFLGGGNNQTALLFSNNSNGVVPPDVFGGAIDMNHSGGSCEVGIWNAYTANTLRSFAFYQRTGATTKNELMRIEAAGRVTTPYQTYALCGFTSAYNSFTVSSNNDIIMDTATQQGSSYNTSNGRFTAPVNGLYHVFISLMMNPPSTNANRLALRKNGSDFQISFDVVQPANGYMQGTGGGSQQSNLNLTCILPLNAGDYVNFAARSGSSVGPIYGGHSWGFFYLIG